MEADDFMEAAKETRQQDATNQEYLLVKERKTTTKTKAST